MGFQNLRVRYSLQQRWNPQDCLLSSISSSLAQIFISDIVSKCFQFSHYFGYFHYFQSHSATGFLALFRQKSFRKAWTFPLQRRQRMHQLLQQQQKRQLKRPCWAVPCCACLKTETVLTMGWHGMAWGWHGVSPIPIFWSHLVQAASVGPQLCVILALADSPGHACPWSLGSCVFGSDQDVTRMWLLDDLWMTKMISWVFDWFWCDDCSV